MHRERRPTRLLLTGRGDEEKKTREGRRLAAGGISGKKRKEAYIYIYISSPFLEKSRYRAGRRGNVIGNVRQQQLRSIGFFLYPGKERSKFHVHARPSPSVLPPALPHIPRQSYFLTSRLTQLDTPRAKERETWLNRLGARGSVGRSVLVAISR